MRFLFNLLGAVLLAFALVFAVADISRTLADGVTQLSTIGEVLAAAGLAPASEPGLSANAVDLLAALSNWPASISFGIAAFFLLFLGRPAHRRGGRYVR